MRLGEMEKLRRVGRSPLGQIREASPADVRGLPGGGFTTHPTTPPLGLWQAPWHGAFGKRATPPCAASWTSTLRMGPDGEAWKAFYPERSAGDLRCRFQPGPSNCFTAGWGGAEGLGDVRRNLGLIDRLLMPTGPSIPFSPPGKMQRRRVGSRLSAQMFSCGPLGLGAKPKDGEYLKRLFAMIWRAKPGLCWCPPAAPLARLGSCAAASRSNNPLRRGPVDGGVFVAGPVHVAGRVAEGWSFRVNDGPCISARFAFTGRGGVPHGPLAHAYMGTVFLRGRDRFFGGCLNLLGRCGMRPRGVAFRPGLTKCLSAVVRVEAGELRVPARRCALLRCFRPCGFGSFRGNGRKPGPTFAGLPIMAHRGVLCASQKWVIDVEGWGGAF